MTYQILTCPNCHGQGCSLCQNTGKVRVSQSQLKKLKTLTHHLPQSTPDKPAPIDQSPSTKSSLLTILTGINPQDFKTDISGIIAFSFLAIITGAGTASWYFLKSLKPFFVGLLSLLTLIGTRLSLQHKFFKLQEPDDLLKIINQKSKK